MAKRPTRDDVARLAGVSAATVSYVINDGPRPVSEETRARVLDAIQELGYRPHAIARSLRTGRTRTVGLLIPTLLSPGFAFLINEVEDCLASHDYALVLASSHENGERESHMLDVMLSQSIDGLLYTPSSPRLRDQVAQLIDDGVPVVFVDRYIPGVPADTVMTDNVKAGRQATEHLIQQGCRHIVCVSFSHEASAALDRVEGYRQALCQNGLPVDEKLILVIPDPAGETGMSALLEYRDTFGLPDGIMCNNQTHTIGVVKALRERGVRVPEQVAVIGGFFVSPWDTLLEPPLPLVNQDMQRMARIAVEFLMRRLGGDDSPPRMMLLDPELILI